MMVENRCLLHHNIDSAVTQRLSDASCHWRSFEMTTLSIGHDV